MKLELYNPKIHGPKITPEYQGTHIVTSSIKLTDIDYDDAIARYVKHVRNAADCPKLSELQAKPSVPAISLAEPRQHLTVSCPERTTQSIGVTSYPVCNKRLDGKAKPTDIDDLRKVECPFMYLTGKVKHATSKVLVAVDAERSF